MAASASFSPKELTLATDTTVIALANAAQSLGKMLKEDVGIENVGLYMGDEMPLPNLGTNDSFFVLSTEVNGEMNAHTLLIFNQENAQKIYKSLLPANVSKQKDMQEAILLEVDNIISAAVVSKFSDILNRHITGHVPYLHEKNLSETRVMIQDQLKQNLDFAFKAYLVSKETKISTLFLCFFSDTFQNTLAKQAEKPETAEMIEHNEGVFGHWLHQLRDLVSKWF